MPGQACLPAALAYILGHARPCRARQSAAYSAPAIAWWLAICAAMVFIMVMLGGATRLTESGLSMVEWKPLTLLPPLNDAEWQAAFQDYRHYPEFLKKNAWMTVDDFKSIFWLEYIHRLWGRLIGAVFFVPFLWFVVRRAVDRPLAGEARRCCSCSADFKARSAGSWWRAGWKPGPT